MRSRFLIVSLCLVAACTDDGASEPGMISLTAVSSENAEGGVFTLIARRLGDPQGAVSVEYQTVDAGATAGIDYTAASGSLAWADGDTESKRIEIRVMNDLMIEAPEALTVTAGAAAGAAGFAPVTLTIRDDDRMGDAIALTSSGRLVGFDREAPGTPRQAVMPAGFEAGEAIVGIDVRPRDGQLYALTDRGALYTIDLASGQATRRVVLAADPGDATAPYTALAGARFGVDFNPVADRLRVVSDAGQNLRIDVDTGRTFTDGALSGAAAGLSAAGYSNNFADTCRTRLYGIDVATDRLVLQDPPNAGTTTAIGLGLGVDASAALLDAVTDATGQDHARAILTVGGQPAMYAIDLASGSASRIGALGLPAGEAVRGFALALMTSATPIRQQPGELFAVTEAGRVLTLNRATPAKPCTNAALAGLGIGDQIVGVDVRPSTGIFYALTNNAGTGKVYALDPMTGAAQAPVTLSQPLVGTTFGVDFNPTGVVALRIVSDSGQNLRVTDVATGATAVDTAVNGGSGISGVAYTNSVPGATMTTLYTIDTAADRLRIQNPPNAGTQVDVGALGVDVVSVAGFDIDGRDGVAIAAFDLAGSAGTTLHTVNLTTGAVSAPLGTIPGARLRGLARPTP